MQNPTTFVARGARAIEINTVLRNTYVLLGLSVGCASVSTFVFMALNVGMMNFFVYLAGFFGLSYAVQKTADSVWGLFWSFVFAAFIGLALAPIMAYYLGTNPALVGQALGLTAATFFALSAYTVIKKADFSWLQQFIFVSFFVVLAIIVLAFFVDISPFAMVISAFMVIVASALILWQTSSIVLGGETNYIVAANTLFVSIYILFMNLLSILGIMSDD